MSSCGVWPVCPHLHADSVHACDGKLPVNEANLFKKKKQKKTSSLCLLYVFVPEWEPERKSHEEDLMVNSVCSPLLSCAYLLKTKSKHYTDPVLTEKTITS